MNALNQFCAQIKDAWGKLMFYAILEESDLSEKIITCELNGKGKIKTNEIVLDKNGYFSKRLIDLAKPMNGYWFDDCHEDAYSWYLCLGTETDDIVACGNTSVPCEWLEIYEMLRSGAIKEIDTRKKHKKEAKRKMSVLEEQECRIGKTEEYYEPEEYCESEELRFFMDDTEQSFLTTRSLHKKNVASNLRRQGTLL